MHSPRVHYHSRHNGREVYGARLEPGESIEDDDVYDHPSGKWQKWLRDHPDFLTVPANCRFKIIRRLPVLTLGAAQHARETANE